jgi:hypothetical protein
VNPSMANLLAWYAEINGSNPTVPPTELMFTMVFPVFS